MAAKPKTTAKRKSASVRVSKKKRGISKFQALAIAGVLALIGVVAVVASHASGTPNYQYSWNKYCVSAYGKDSAKEVQDCKNTSAEALVYRLYRGLYGKKSPDDGGYKYWTQKFAGDRLKVTQSSLVRDRVSKMGNDRAFVTALYTDMLTRKPSNKEVTYWTAKLNAAGSKKWSRERVAYQFAASKEAINKNQAGWTAFVATAPTVAVVQTAADEQKARFKSMYDDYQKPAAASEKAAKDALSTAKAQLSKASKSAKKNPPTASDLSAITASQTAAADAANSAASAANDAATKQAAAKRLYDKAKELADYATDIKDNKQYGLAEIGKRYRETKSSATSAKSYAASAKARISDIAKQYTIAKQKYDAEQKRLAEEAARKAAAAAKAARDKADQYAADVNKVLATVHNENCYKYSYTVLGDATSKSINYLTKSGATVNYPLYKARDVVVSGKGANTVGCKTASSGWSYSATGGVPVGQAYGPHYPVKVDRSRP